MPVRAEAMAFVAVEDCEVWNAMEPFPGNKWKQDKTDTSRTEELSTSILLRIFVVLALPWAPPYQ